MTKHATTFLPEDTGRELRDLAAAVGIRITRGPGTGEIGSIRGLCVALGKAYKSNPDEVAAALSKLLAAADEGEEDEPVHRAA